MKYYIGFLLILFLGIYVFFKSCNIAGGTHGSIKSYIYPVTKYELQKAVNSILLNSNNIKRDSIDHFIFDVTDPNNVDTIHDNYYNDGDKYMTIYITKGEIVNEYKIRYAGDSTDWDTSKISDIFIAYAHDKDSNGGSEGNGDFSFRWGLKRKFTKLFEEEFIAKVDKRLGVSHTVSE